MRKLLLGTAALMAFSNPAISADRAPVFKAPPPVASVWTWTGCYVGGQVGWTGDCRFEAHDLQVVHHGLHDGAAALVARA